MRIRALAVSRGLRLNEWGVFELDERVGGETELEVFSAVGLPWIPPELPGGSRGGGGRGVGQGLPNLLELQDLLGDLHAHSTWSDGRDSIRDMARASLELGYEYLCVTDHSQSLTMAGGLTPDRVRRQWAEIDEVQEGVGLSVLKGLEVDILRDGYPRHARFGPRGARPRSGFRTLVHEFASGCPDGASDPGHPEPQCRRARPPHGPAARTSSLIRIGCRVRASDRR